MKKLYLALLLAMHGACVYADITHDLELAKIFTAIDRTQTAQGKKALQAIFATPTSDITLLSHRQAAIAYLVNHNALHKQIVAALDQVKKHEHAFEHGAQLSSVEQISLEQFYFSSERFKRWNTNPLALGLGYLAHCGNLMSSTVQHGLTFLIFNWGLGEEHVCAVHPANHGHGKKKKDDHKHKDDKHHDHAHKGEKSHDHKHKDCKHQDHKHAHCAHDHDHTQHGLLKALKSALLAWHTVAFVQDAYGAYVVTSNEMQIIKQMQQQLMEVACGMCAMNGVHDLLHNHPEITAHLSAYKNFDFINTHAHVSNKLSTLLALLKTNTFKGKPSAFSRVGNILAAHRLLQEARAELEPVLQAIGEIDACSSCANLMQEHQSGSTCYSFAHYAADQTTPCIETCNFWHPLIDVHDVKMNSLALGTDDGKRNALFTGPNACGKSTNLKTLTLCAYCAQTLTIVPAEYHNQSLFKEIYSSMVVADRLQEGKSLFVTEFENALALLERVAKLAPGECMFVAFDELFKSTQHEKGQEVARQLLQKLYACPNVITVATTHFEDLTQLADKDVFSCANYTVSNFELVPGIGTSANAKRTHYFD